MSDTLLAGLWLAVLGGGLGACVALRALGVPTTYVRDVLHVGTGLWVLGWPAWHGPLAPSCIVLLALAGVLAVPALGPRLPWLQRLERSVSGDEERWSGIVLYTASYAALTCLGLRLEAYPAAAALLALSLGDGIGGAVGRRFGRHRYRLAWGKSKSLEGSAAVALFAASGAGLAAALLGGQAGPWSLGGVGVVAATAEALAPRASDNLAVPASVWIFLTLVP